MDLSIGGGVPIVFLCCLRRGVTGDGIGSTIRRG